jgi:hypothetical protein
MLKVSIDFPDNPDGVFYAGSRLKGIVELEAPKAIEISSKFDCQLFKKLEFLLYN